jgi:hypothetical protein
MALEIFNGTSIPREFATAAMEFLWAKWKVLATTGGLSVQRLIEETSYHLRPNLTCLLSHGEDFIYVYVGDVVAEESGANHLGTLLSQSSNPLAKEFAEVYRRAGQTLKPSFVRFTNSRSQSGTIWQRLILPIRLADDVILLAIYTELISHRLEVYEHLFRTAVDAMIIAGPIANDVGHTVDGWVLMMNDAARERLGFSGSIGNLRLSSLPQFRDIGAWGRLYAPKGAPIELRTVEFDLELMRFPRVFGLRLRPKAPAGDPLQSTGAAPPLAPDAPTATPSAVR